MVVLVTAEFAMLVAYMQSDEETETRAVYRAGAQVRRCAGAQVRRCPDGC